MLKKSVISYTQTRNIENPYYFDIKGGIIVSAKLSVDEKYIKDPRASREIKKRIEKVLLNEFYSRKFKEYIYELTNLAMRGNYQDMERIIQLRDLMEKEMEFNN